MPSLYLLLLENFSAELSFRSLALLLHPFVAILAEVSHVDFRQLDCLFNHLSHSYTQSREQVVLGIALVLYLTLLDPALKISIALLFEDR